MEGKKVLLFGLGFFQRRLLKAVARSRPCVVVDRDKILLEKVKDEGEDIEILQGEASSIVTWKKLDVENISHIVTAIQDYDIVMEICRIAREFFKLDMPIIILWYGDSEEKEGFDTYGAKTIDPLDMGIGAVVGLVEKNYSRPSNIGLGLGEIAEVTILRRSHLVERKMKYINPTRWKIAAAYRDGKLIIPDDDFILQIGDRAILVGDPKVVDNIVNILMRGLPEFPLQFGQILAVLADRLDEKDFFELRSFGEKSKARKTLWYNIAGDKHEPKELVQKLEKDFGFKKGGTLKNFRAALFVKDIGVLALSGIKTFTMFNIKMRYFFRRSRSPFLITRGGFPYGEIIISLNGKAVDAMIELGTEVAALFDVPFSFVYVTPIAALRTSRDTAQMRLRQTRITDLENLISRKINFRQPEGNPVKETLNLVDGRQDVLLVVSADSREPISFFKPHVPYILASRSPCSVLVIPSEDSDE